jgi:hypothetical protein
LEPSPGSRHPLSLFAGVHKDYGLNVINRENGRCRIVVGANTLLAAGNSRSLPPTLRQPRMALRLRREEVTAKNAS